MDVPFWGGWGNESSTNYIILIYATLLRGSKRYFLGGKKLPQVMFPPSSTRSSINWYPSSFIQTNGILQQKNTQNYPYIHLQSKVWSPFPKKQKDPTKMIQLFLLTPRNSRKIRSASLTLLSATLSSFLRKRRGCVVGRGGNQRINWGTKIRYIIIVIQQFTRHCTVLNYCNFFLRISYFV